jgi:hypothetical protein
MKPLFKNSVRAILDWWKPAAIRRYKKLKLEGRLDPEKLFYSTMDSNINRSINEKDAYEEVKKKFFKNVGK